MSGFVYLLSHIDPTTLTPSSTAENPVLQKYDPIKKWFNIETMNCLRLEVPAVLDRWQILYVPSDLK